MSGTASGQVVLIPISCDQQRDHRRARSPPPATPVPSRPSRGRTAPSTRLGAPWSPWRRSGAREGSAALGTSVKLYPCCRYTHGGIDLLLDVVREEELVPADVESISCGVLAAGSQLVAEPLDAKRRVAGPVDAQFQHAVRRGPRPNHPGGDARRVRSRRRARPRAVPADDRIGCHRSERLEAASRRPGVPRSRSACGAEPSYGGMRPGSRAARGGRCRTTTCATGGGPHRGAGRRDAARRLPDDPRRRAVRSRQARRRGGRLGSPERVLVGERGAQHGLFAASRDL